eukprot:3288946-Amphidinium_carterae.1
MQAKNEERQARSDLVIVPSADASGWAAPQLDKLIAYAQFGVSSDFAEHHIPHLGLTHTSVIHTLNSEYPHTQVFADSTEASA